MRLAVIGPAGDEGASDSSDSESDILIEESGEENIEMLGCLRATGMLSVERLIGSVASFTSMGSSLAIDVDVGRLADLSVFNRPGRFGKARGGAGPSRGPRNSDNIGGADDSQVLRTLEASSDGRDTVS